MPSPRPRYKFNTFVIRKASPSIRVSINLIYRSTGKSLLLLRLGRYVLQERPILLQPSDEEIRNVEDKFDTIVSSRNEWANVISSGHVDVTKFDIKNSG